MDITSALVPSKILLKYIHFLIYCKCSLQVSFSFRCQRPRFLCEDNYTEGYIQPIENTP